MEYYISLSAVTTTIYVYESPICVYGLWVSNPPLKSTNNPPPPILKYCE